MIEGSRRTSIQITLPQYSEAKKHFHVTVRQLEKDIHKDIESYDYHEISKKEFLRRIIVHLFNRTKKNTPRKKKRINGCQVPKDRLTRRMGF